MGKQSKIIIYGNDSMARVLYSYAKSNMNICGFTVDDCCIVIKANTWNDLRLFISVSLTCSKCAQKHNTLFPVELQKTLATNVEELLKTYKKIGMWGVIFHTIGLYNDFDVFKSPNVVAIDNVSSNQMIDLYGKKVFSPDILAEDDIPLVISFFQNSTQQLSMQIKEMYPHVEKIIDVSQLLII